MRKEDPTALVVKDSIYSFRICPFPVFQSLYRKWAHRKGRRDAGGFSGLIEGLPELIDACNGRESVFAGIVGQEFQSSQISQVGLQMLSHEEHTGNMSECWFTTETRERTKSNDCKLCTIYRNDLQNGPIYHVQIT